MSGQWFGSRPNAANERGEDMRRLVFRLIAVSARPPDTDAFSVTDSLSRRTLFVHRCQLTPLAQAIDDVLRDGSVVTIVYSATAADGGPKKKGIMSPLRTPRAASQQKVFEAGQDRDAQILQEILLLVQRKAKAAAAGDAEFPCPKLMDMRAKLEERRNRLQRASPV